MYLLLNIYELNYIIFNTSENIFLFIDSTNDDYQEKIINFNSLKLIINLL